MSAKHEMPGNETSTGDPGTLMIPTLDIELLLSINMDESQPCDHQDHGQHYSHEDGNEHYMKVVAPCGHHCDGEIFVVCWRWIEYSRSLSGIRCAVCSDIQPFDVANKVLGPVKDYLK